MAKVLKTISFPIPSDGSARLNPLGYQEGVVFAPCLEITKALNISLSQRTARVLTSCLYLFSEAKLGLL
jgi:hypothetical protein